MTCDAVAAVGHLIKKAPLFPARSGREGEKEEGCQSQLSPTGTDVFSLLSQMNPGWQAEVRSAGGWPR